MSEPTVHDYRTLLTQALGTPTDADTEAPDFHTLFTPSSHRLALDPDVTVVRGFRGTGKTYWAKALTDPELRGIAADAYMMPRLRRTEVRTGFGTDRSNSPAFPDTRTIRGLVDAGVRPDELWPAVVLNVLGTPAVRQLPNWTERVRWTRENFEAYGDALQQADQETRNRKETLVLLFDGLEHLHPDRRQADLLLSGLFQTALELRLTTGTLRAKIFVRPDMYDSAPKVFADASKLGANATNLVWSRENLYGLLFHKLGNHDGPEAKKFREATGDWRAEGDGRYLPPVALLADQEQQEKVFITLAGPFMGKDRRKGHTYTWVPNHLQDGKGQVSPRTWLSTLGKAARITSERFAGHPVPLHYDAISASLSTAASVRVAELKDDLGWAALAVEQLEGEQVPLQATTVHYAWRAGSLASKVRALLESEKGGSGPRNLDDPVALVQELHDLGVVTKRGPDSVDLPDIYRLAFDIGRRGGVPRMPV
ncbi:hypothetical protein DIZ27_11195 [Streptomyces sp. NWU339]|uniref:hypothetical protein n=1 Tax=Streptomyces sp. NWU339 TaxID=2185284 RepID=UPI000D67611D|nr:hypothetical protein [Streptomyces sp. NWU339]PWI10545.1 hypothetical protein DIZ27_11195 [Streptomyces sp. NWU339]